MSDGIQSQKRNKSVISFNWIHGSIFASQFITVVMCVSFTHTHIHSCLLLFFFFFFSQVVTSLRSRSFSGWFCSATCPACPGSTPSAMVTTRTVCPRPTWRASTRSSWRPGSEGSRCCSLLVSDDGGLQWITDVTDCLCNISLHQANSSVELTLFLSWFLRSRWQRCWLQTFRSTEHLQAQFSSLQVKYWHILKTFCYFYICYQSLTTSFFYSDFYDLWPCCGCVCCN